MIVTNDCGSIIYADGKITFVSNKEMMIDENDLAYLLNSFTKMLEFKCKGGN